MDYQVITRERHGLKHWRNQSNYQFAAVDALCPVVVQELPKAMLAMPIAFISEGEHFIPVAVQGLAPGQNLLVAADGRWLATYVPASYRVYPFRMIAMEKGEQVLCIDEAKGLSADGTGKPFFDEEGAPSQSVKEILEFFQQLDANRQLTQGICALLQRHGLLQPWPITIHKEQGEQKVEGLFRIDEDALNALSAEALVEVRTAGGLTMAYCQLLSMQHLSTLGALAQVHAEAEKARQAQALAPQNREFNQGFMNDGGTFSFGS